MELQENVARTSKQYNEPQVLIKVLTQVRIVLTKRTKLSPTARLKKKKPCSLYDTLYDQVPLEIQNPHRNFSGRLFGFLIKGSKDALFPENLKAIVKLITFFIYKHQCTLSHRLSEMTGKTKMKK